ncbi:MAG: hypothetical protein AAGH70_11485 [Pseudomonadota bacterium]
MSEKQYRWLSIGIGILTIVVMIWIAQTATPGMLTTSRAFWSCDLKEPEKLISMWN